jgi:chromosome condensin MukBEF ATPase and DNA-binding subunit MukB
MVRFVPLLSFVVAFAVLSPAVFAQPTQREHDACTRDVARHCRAVMNNGDQAVLACLKEHRARISRGCNKVLTDHGQ